MAGVEVPLFIIGDAAYPLRSWLMKGYPETGRLTANQVNFNYRLSGARMVVERAFGLLKSKWRCLSRLNESKVTLLAFVCVYIYPLTKESSTDFFHTLRPKFTKEVCRQT